MNKSLSTKFDD